MEDHSSAFRQDSNDSYSSDDDVPEVAGVPIRLLALQESSSRSELNDAGAKNGPTTTLPETSHPPIFQPVAAQLEARRIGQQRAEERELVRQAARRGVAFGFIIRSRTHDAEGGVGQKTSAGEERRRCEAVQGGRVVEASFAKGEWGVRWRE